MSRSSQSPLRCASRRTRAQYQQPDGGWKRTNWLEFFCLGLGILEVAGRVENNRNLLMVLEINCRTKTGTAQAVHSLIIPDNLQKHRKANNQALSRMKNLVRQIVDYLGRHTCKDDCKPHLSALPRIVFSLRPHASGLIYKIRGKIVIWVFRSFCEGQMQWPDQAAAIIAQHRWETSDELSKLPRSINQSSNYINGSHQSSHAVQVPTQKGIFIDGRCIFVRRRLLPTILPRLWPLG